jgi:hypothetical protein
MQSCELRDADSFIFFHDKVAIQTIITYKLMKQQGFSLELSFLCKS